jgi:hypothetical protein
VHEEYWVAHGGGRRLRQPLHLQASRQRDGPALERHNGRTTERAKGDGAPQHFAGGLQPGALVLGEVSALLAVEFTVRRSVLSQRRTEEQRPTARSAFSRPMAGAQAATDDARELRTESSGPP